MSSAGAGVDYELSVAVLDSKGLPPAGAVVTCNFAGHVQSITLPPWSQELKWTITPKELQSLKAVNTPIKLVFTSTSPVPGNAGLGTAVIPLRTAQMNSGYEWYSLVKSSLREPPRVKVLAKIVPRPAGAKKDEKQTMLQGAMANIQERDSRDDFALSDEVKVFNFNFNIHSVQNLDTLSSPSPPPPENLRARFRLFDAPVESTNFLSAQKVESGTGTLSKSPVNHVTNMQLKSSAAGLVRFLEQNPEITVEIINTEDHSAVVGKVVVPICKMVAGGMFQPLHGTYSMVEWSGHSREGNSASMTVSAKLEAAFEAPSNAGVADRSVDLSRDASLAADKSEADTGAGVANPQDESQAPDNSNAQGGAPPVPPSGDTTDDEDLANDEEVQWRFAIEVKSVKLFDMQSASVYVKYNYPLFGGGAATFKSKPPVVANRRVDCKLPNAFCAFEFSMGRARLVARLVNEPLTIEVYHRDKYTKDVLIGKSVIPFAKVLQARPEVGSHPGSSSQRAETTGVVSALDENGNSKRVATLNVGLQLEQAYRVEENIRASTEIRPQLDMMQAAAEGDTLYENARETPAYQAAWELEMWKTAEEEKFMASLREREQQRMVMMEQEWKKRFKEQEESVEKRMTEYTKLEGKLKAALFEVERRERKLILAEEDLDVRRVALEKENEQRNQEAQLAARRVRDEYAHQAALEKARQAEVMNLNDMLRRRVEEADERYRNLDKEFQNYKKEQATQPQAVLQAEVTRMVEACSEMEKRLDAANRQKTKYKSQLMRALKQIKDMKDTAEKDMAERLAREEKERQQIKIAAIAKDESSALNAERQELHGLRQELETLKYASSAAQQRFPLNVMAPSLHPAQHVSGGLAMNAGAMMHGMEGGMGGSLKSSGAGKRGKMEEVQRLLNEREELLKTGVYTEDDAVVAQLNEKINALGVQLDTPKAAWV